MPARPTLRTHLARCRLLGVGDDDPLFANPASTAVSAEPRDIRNAVARTCSRLNYAPTWRPPRARSTSTSWPQH